MSRSLLLLFLCAPGAAQEQATFKVRDAWIGAVCFVGDGQTLLAGSSAGLVQHWRVPGQKEMNPLPQHKNAVAALAASADGRLIASAGHDHRALLYEFPRPTNQREFPHHRGAVLAVALSPDGKLLATGGIDAAIRLVDVSKPGRPEVVLKGHRSWVNSLVFDAAGERLVSGSSDNTVRLWSVRAQRTELSFTVKEGEVRSVALSRDGKRIAAGVRYGGVRVWDVESKKEIANLRAHEGETWAVAFSPDGATLISGGGDWHKPSEVRLWDTTTWKETATLRHPGEVLCVAVSPDGKAVAAGGGEGTVKVWALDAVRKPTRP